MRPVGAFCQFSSSPSAFRCLLLLFAFGVTTAAFVSAQEQIHPKRQLTLDGAVELALRQNLDSQIATLNIATAQEQRALALSELLPHASLDATETISRYNLKALIGVQFPAVGKSIGPYQSVHAGPAFSGPVFDLTLIREYQASGHRLRAVREDEQSVREETVLLTVSEYMVHLGALASIDAAESRVQLATDLMRQAQDLLNEGVASKIDVSRADVRLREEQQRLIDAQRDADTSMNALRRILNIHGTEEIELLDRDGFTETPSLELVNPIETAVSQRPELRSLTETIRADNLERKAAFAHSLPTLGFTGRWNEQGQTLTTVTPGYEYAFEFRTPIFTGGRLRAERKTAALEEVRAERQFDQARNRVTEQVLDGQVELQSALHQVSLGRKQVALANDELTLSQGRFKAGVTDNIEVIAAQDSLARANDQEISALFRYNIARAQLARAVGAGERTYSH